MRRLLLLPFLVAGVLTLARAAEVLPPVPANYFNDYAGVVSSGTAQALDADLRQFERATSNQILVAVYPTMQTDSSIEDYTVRIAEAWKVGQKALNNGGVLFVFVREHKLFIQTGYGLEGALPDATAKRIIESEIVPRFRQNDYDGGLRAGVAAILAATKGEYHGTGAVAGDRQTGGFPLPFGVIFFLVIIVISFIRSRQQTVYRGTGRRSLWGAAPWLFMGGGGGGFGGGGGGGGGGFSGGGGGFGGGGAGGSW